MRRNYEADPAAFPADAYTVQGYRGVAWYALGWDEERTGSVVCCMVGDDRHFLIDPSELAPLERADYCGACGQIGCPHG